MSRFDGALNVTVLVREGRAVEVRIVSPRQNIAPAFIGRSPEEAAVVAKNLFSLCPAAQSIAAQAAGEAALGQIPDPEQGRRRRLGLLSERFSEMLRASVLDWPQDDPRDLAGIDVLRKILPMLRALPDSDEAQRLLARIEQASGGLGLRGFAGGTGYFARRWTEAAVDEANWRSQDGEPDCEPDLEPDFLRASDDDEVAQAMSDPKFSLLPALAGRCVETGAFARQGGGGFANSLSGRLAARFADMAATLDAIAALLAGHEAPAGLLAAANMGQKQGFAAVDSSRGKLYHALWLDGGGRIADYRVVAPTEWNFHPDGPFVRLLLGANIGTGPAARRRVERLAFVFDPCIAVGVEIRELADA